jgi:hypothetical protein
MKAKEIKETKQEETQTTKAPVQPQGPTAIPETLTQQQALQVLVDAAKIAQSKGAFSLDDAELVNKAIKAFAAPAGPTPTNG